MRVISESSPLSFLYLVVKETLRDIGPTRSDRDLVPESPAGRKSSSDQKHPPWTLK